MALVIPVGFADAAFQFRRDGDPDPYVITFGVDVSNYGGDYSLLATELVTEFYNSRFDGVMSTDTTLSGVQLRIGQDGGDPLTLFYDFNAVGTSGAAQLPQNSAILITKQTDRAGRTGKGRWFLPWIAEGACSNIGVVDPTYRGTVQTAAFEFLNAMSNDMTFAAPMMLLHNVGAPGGTTPTLVTALSANAVIATQRRRLR